MDNVKIFWEKAYSENAAKLLGVCRRYVANNQLAEDLMHDAFVQAMNKYNTYKGKGSFEGWLRKIAVNTALMYIRAQKVKKIDNDALATELMHDDMSEEYNIKTTKHIIELAEFSSEDLIEQLEQLPEYHKLVFNLHVIDGYKHTDIAKQLNISVGTSKSHLSRARKKLQDLLYKKALQQIPEKNDDRKKKNRALLLLPLVCADGYIDSIFRHQLSSYAIPSTCGFSSTFSSVEWANVGIPAPSIFSYLYSVKVWIYCSVSIIGILLYPIGVMDDATFCTSDDSSVDLSTRKIIYDTCYQNNAAPIAVDSVKNEADSITISKKIKQEPIVVRKQVIEHRTIVVVDTVIIKRDSTNEE